MSNIFLEKILNRANVLKNRELGVLVLKVEKFYST